MRRAVTLHLPVVAINVSVLFRIVEKVAELLIKRLVNANVHRINHYGLEANARKKAAKQLAIVWDGLAVRMLGV